MANAVSTCGQLWDGATFKTVNVDGVSVITLLNSDGNDNVTPTLIKSNCGVGLDGRFFKIADGVVSLLTEETPET